MSRLSRARRCLLRALVLLFCLKLAAAAQTVRPIITEYEGQARGQVEFINDSLTPLSVVLEPRSFEVAEDGSISYGPLPSGIHLKLSTMSFRLSPKQGYTVFYDAKADRLPAWFVIYGNFTGIPARKASGVNIQIELPHTVYLLPKTGLKKSEVTIQKAEFDRGQKRIALTLANSGDNFGRLMIIDALGHRTQKSSNGFPMFPHSRRMFDVPWDSAEAPEKLKLRFSNFTLETVVAKQP